MCDFHTIITVMTGKSKGEEVKLGDVCVLTVLFILKYIFL